jgi:hypothetical protein
MGMALPDGSQIIKLDTRVEKETTSLTASTTPPLSKVKAKPMSLKKQMQYIKRNFQSD